MSDDIQDLKKGYRDIEAPPHLATRIHAEVADRPILSRPWLPAAATMVVMSALILPFMSQQTTTTPPAQAVPTKPSLSALASLTPDRPQTRTPNLTQMRSVTVPRMPRKPRISTQRPQSQLETEFEILEEKDHADV